MIIFRFGICLAFMFLLTSCGANKKEIFISSNPAGASVFIDNSLKGKTPILIDVEFVDDITYSGKLSQDGFNDYYFEINQNQQSYQFTLSANLATNPTGFLHDGINQNKRLSLEEKNEFLDKQSGVLARRNQQNQQTHFQEAYKNYQKMQSGEIPQYAVRPYQRIPQKYVVTPPPSWEQYYAPWWNPDVENRLQYHRVMPREFVLEPKRLARSPLYPEQSYDNSLTNRMDDGVNSTNPSNPAMLERDLMEEHQW